MTGTFSASSALLGAVTRTRSSNTTVPPSRINACMSSHITDRRGSGSAATGAARKAMASAAPAILSTSDLPRTVSCYSAIFLFCGPAVGQPVPVVYFFYGTTIQQLGHDVTDAIGQIMAVLLDRHADRPF